MTEQENEKMELRHEPVKGYTAAFYGVVGIAALYLVVVFVCSL